MYKESGSNYTNNELGELIWEKLRVMVISEKTTYNAHEESRAFTLERI